MAEMRFELNADNVSTLIDMIYDIVAFKVDKKPYVGNPYLSRLEKIAKKIKAYGADAFETRDKYRFELKRMFDFLETIKKEIQGK
jgi:hypothetical protein